MSADRTVLRCSSLRMLTAAATRIGQLAKDGDTDPDDILDVAHRELADVSGRIHGNLGEHISVQMGRLVDQLRKPVQAIPTPWPEINDSCIGWKHGALHIIGARQAVGKSIMGIQAAVHAAKAGVPVLYVSMELTSEDIIRRIIASEGRKYHLDIGRLMKGHDALTAIDWERIDAAEQWINTLPLRILDKPNQSIAEIKASARQYMRETKAKPIIIIDHIGLARPSSDRVPRHEQVAAMSRSCKTMAMELACPVIVMSQIRRALGAIASTAVIASDLSESKSLEQDADVVILLQKDTTDGTEGGEPTGEVGVRMAKVRHGRETSFNLARSGRYQRFDSLNRHQDGAEIISIGGRA